MRYWRWRSASFILLRMVIGVSARRGSFFRFPSCCKNSKKNFVFVKFCRFFRLYSSIIRPKSAHDVNIDLSRDFDFDYRRKIINENLILTLSLLLILVNIVFIHFIWNLKSCLVQNIKKDTKYLLSNRNFMSSVPSVFKSSYFID